ncbi:MAG: hypothetical protein ACFE0P_03990 [Oceanicaulis sp.]
MLLTVLTALALQAAGCTDSAPHRAFDFWLGRWNVYAADGAYAGKNHIASGGAGCVLTESWESVRGGTGHSLNFVEPTTGAWRQVWVGRNHRIDYSGGLDAEGRMVLTGEITYWNADGAQSHDFRGAWTPLENGHVIQHFQQRDAETGAWSDWGLLTYVPAREDPNGAAPAADVAGPAIETAPPAFD